MSKVINKFDEIRKFLESKPDAKEALEKNTIEAYKELWKKWKDEDENEDEAKELKKLIRETMVASIVKYTTIFKNYTIEKRLKLWTHGLKDGTTYYIVHNEEDNDDYIAVEGKIDCELIKKLFQEAEKEIFPDNPLKKLTKQLTKQLRCEYVKTKVGDEMKNSIADVKEVENVL